MKPLHLIMSAFGPYKEKVEVDFTKLGDNGIFLITGDTGAGKTTIFDGISFALFGESSGTHRESTTFRSNFAKSTTETYVTLTFTHQNKKYTITRNPSYLVPKKRGEGETQKPSDATLEYDDKIITGLKTVNEKIIDILGINANQFKQISMLAQGEFLKILFANSDERKTIFRKIFNTEIFDLITNKLNEKYKNNKDEIENLKTEFITNANNIVLNNEALFLDKNTITKDSITKTITALENELITNEKNNQEIDKKIKQIESLLKQQETNIKNIEENNKRITEYKYLLEQEKQLNNEEKNIEQEREIIKKNNKILRIIKPIEFNIESINKEIKTILSKIESKNKQIKESTELVKHIDFLEEEIKKLNPLIENYNNLKNELNITKELITNIEEVISYYKDKKKLDENYIIKYEEYLQLDLKYKEEDDKNFRNQAGILATKLKDKTPCPVCGSIDHPNIAKVEKNVLTKEELELLKNNVESTLKQVNVIKQSISSVNSKIELVNTKINCQNEQDVSKLKEEIIEKNINLKNNKENIITEFNKIYRLITSSDTNTNIDSFVYVDFLDKFNKENKQTKEELQLNIKLLKEYDETKIKLETNLSKETDNLITTINQLGYKTKDEYTNSILTEEEVNKLDQHVKKYENDKIINKTKIEELSKQLTSIDIIDLDDEYKKLSNITSELELVNSEKQKVFNIYSNNLKIKNKLDKTRKKLITYMEKFSTYEELYKLSSGTISGKRRVSFEQYVQATYFDMILYEANIRLQNMTDGRFKLLRKETSNSLNAKFALDLDVYDEYNGHRRDVKSLSGGESFKASLSLALGLSDVIQNYSGGIVIDTLFIDEGFGSLDQESREQAINTLNLISNNNKLIGIISHVSELKDRIDKKIIVKKTKEGSEIKIET